MKNKCVKGIISLASLAVCAGLFGGCAAVVPPELTGARETWQRASAGPAAQLAPAELHKAEVALSQAEKAFQDNPGSDQTKDLAYVAERKARIAEAFAVIAEEKESAAQANRDYQATQGEIVRRYKEDADKAREKQASEEKARVDAEKHAAEEKARVEAEKRVAEEKARVEAEKLAAEARERLVSEEKARMDAEKLAAEAKEQLTKLAVVKEGPRGLVITLSGSVLFASGKAVLLPSAKSRLAQVAGVLLENKSRILTVEGHTDSQGAAKYNLELSRRRAEAVRDYFVQRGYPATNIRTRGMGKDHPVADNASPEGRANNRRVEVIVEHETGHETGT